MTERRRLAEVRARVAVGHRAPTPQTHVARNPQVVIGRLTLRQERSSPSVTATTVQPPAASSDGYRKDGAAVGSVPDQPAWASRMNSWNRNFRLWAYPLLGPPLLVAALIVPVPSAIFVFWLAALTPGTLVLMWEQARDRGMHPQADEKTSLRITIGSVALVLTLVATYFALQRWGNTSGAVGAVLCYGLMWATARHVAAQLEASQQRREAAARLTTSE